MKKKQRDGSCVSKRKNRPLVTRRPNPYKKIAKATKEHQVVSNELNREFKQGIPGKVLLTDITYLPYNGSKWPICQTIKDASTNELLAYHVSDRITLDIATNTIKKLIKNKKNSLHSKKHLSIPIKGAITQAQDIKSC